MAATLYRVQCICGRTSPASEDVAVIDQAWAFGATYTAAEVAALGAISDSTAGFTVPGSSNLDDLVDAYEDFLNTLAGTMNDHYTWTELKVIRADAAHPVPNTPVRTHTMSITGTGGNVLPPQVACDVTLKVASRRHWGRYYVPGQLPENVDTYGRWDDALCDTQEAAYVTLAGAMAGFHWFPIVLTAGSPSPGTGHTVNGVYCDNVADVIRRRRWDAATYRALDTIPP